MHCQLSERLIKVSPVPLPKMAITTFEEAPHRTTVASQAEAFLNSFQSSVLPPAEWGWTIQCAGAALLGLAF